MGVTLTIDTGSLDTILSHRTQRQIKEDYTEELLNIGPTYVPVGQLLNCVKQTLRFVWFYYVLNIHVHYLTLALRY